MIKISKYNSLLIGGIHMKSKYNTLEKIMKQIIHFADGRCSIRSW